MSCSLMLGYAVASICSSLIAKNFKVLVTTEGPFTQVPRGRKPPLLLPPPGVWVFLASSGLWRALWPGRGRADAGPSRPHLLLPPSRTPVPAPLITSAAPGDGEEGQRAPEVLRLVGRGSAGGLGAPHFLFLSCEGFGMPRQSLRPPGAPTRGEAPRLGHA